MKTNKSYSKRLRVTKNGKIIARKPGQDHFNAKESQIGRLSKRKNVTMEMDNKTRGRFLPNS